MSSMSFVFRVLSLSCFIVAACIDWSLVLFAPRPDGHARRMGNLCCSLGLALLVLSFMF